MRLAVAIATVLVSAALLSACGGSGDGSEASTDPQPRTRSATAPAGATAHECEGGAGAKAKLRATGLPCTEALGLVAAWERADGCAPAAGASRSACEITGGYRCLSVVTDRGVAVSCARPGRSIAFTAKRGRA